MEHHIGILDDLDLSKKLIMLRLEDADDMEETLRTYQRIESRHFQGAMGSSEIRQRGTSSTPTPSKLTRAVRAIHVESGSSDSTRI